MRKETNIESLEDILATKLELLRRRMVSIVVIHMVLLLAWVLSIAVGVLAWIW